MIGRKIWLLAFVPVLIGAAVLYVYLKLEPSRRFDSNKLPVLAVPVPSTEAPVTMMDPAEESGPNAVKATTAPEKPPKDEKEPAGMNILMLGIDRRANEVSRADSIMLVHVNVKDKRVTIISLPRDTRVFLPEVGWTKVNHAHLLGEVRNGNEGGTREMVQVVSNFFQVPIHYYVKTDFNGFAGIIDEIGGVEVELSQSVPLDHVKLESGKQQVEGATALGLARERLRMPNGDFDRQKDQIAILRAVADKMLVPSRLLELPKLWSKIKSDVVDTNFTETDLFSLAWMFKGTKGKDLVHVTVPGKPGKAEDPLVGQTLWYWNPDMEGVRKVREEYLLQ